MNIILLLYIVHFRGFYSATWVLFLSRARIGGPSWGFGFCGLGFRVLVRKGFATNPWRVLFASTPSHAARPPSRRVQQYSSPNRPLGGRLLLTVSHRGFALGFRV